MVTLNTAGIVARSTLRDCQNRLRKIREYCGATDDIGSGPKGSGNEFQDMMKRFNTKVVELMDQIRKRNDEERRGGIATDIARASHDINMAVKEVKSMRDGIKMLVEKAVHEAAKTNAKYTKKGKKPEDLTAEQQKKLKDREQAAKDRQKALDNCNIAVESLDTLNAERGKSLKQLAIEKGAGGKGVPPKIKNATMAKYLDRAKRRKQDPDAEPENGRLEDDPETAQQMKDITQKKKEEDAALDRILNLTRELEQQAMMIGETLEEQNAKLSETQDKADKAKQDLKGLNKGLGKLLKDQKPMNMIINIICFILIISLVGFFLNQFGVV